MCAFCEGVFMRPGRQKASQQALIDRWIFVRVAQRARRRRDAQRRQARGPRLAADSHSTSAIRRSRAVDAYQPKGCPIVRGRYSASRRKQAARRRRSAPHVHRWTNSQWWTSSAPAPSGERYSVETSPRASSWSSRRSAARTRPRGTKLDGKLSY